jgi:hypothetical protein
MTRRQACGVSPGQDIRGLKAFHRPQGQEDMRGLRGPGAFLENHATTAVHISEMNSTLVYNMERGDGT